MIRANIEHYAASLKCFKGRQMNKFVPADALIPEGLVTHNFKARMLTIHDLVKDYDAVMSSAQHLKGLFGTHDTWPEGLTLEDDLVDLGWHQREFKLRRSFAYTVMSLDETKCLGCFYIEPSEKVAFEARVILWVRQSELDTGLEQQLERAVKQWLKDQWWFSTIAFPGRDLTWSQWDALQDKVDR
jgi:hypothetical protein